jgi:hypothetical protein
MTREVKIFIFWGQSNMTGYGYDFTDIPNNLNSIGDRVFIWNTFSHKLEAYNAGDNSATIDFDNTVPQPFGPEGQFLYLYNQDHPNDLVYAFKYGVGGSGLGRINGFNDWFPDDNELFLSATVQLNALKATAFLNGYIPKVEAIIGMQGERDADGPLGLSYETNKGIFYAAAVTAWADGNASIKFIDGRINTNPDDSVDAVRLGQACAASVWGSSLAKLVNTDDLATKEDTGVHFTGPELVRLGSRMYNAYMDDADSNILDVDALCIAG